MICLTAGGGVNSGFQIGELDIANNINGFFSDGGACKNVITWLQAIIITGNNQNNGLNLDELITEAFNQIPFDWGLEASADELAAADPEPTIEGADNDSSGEGEMRFDVNFDGRVTPADALNVINILNGQLAPEGENGLLRGCRCWRASCCGMLMETRV